jgi:hypothetical protein
VFSQTVTFTVTVTRVSPAVAVPVGNVTLKNGTCALGTPVGGPTAVNSYGKASFNVSSLTVGTHTITGCYLGNPNFEPSDGDVSQVVNKAETSTAVSSNANPSVFSQTVTFTVTVTPDAPAVETPVGNVTLKDGTCAAGTSIGGPTALDGTGVATFNVSTLTVGAHTVTGCYAGNASFEESEGNRSQQVDPASTTTTITSSVNPAILAQPITFSVTVGPVFPAVATPAGDVTLKDGTCDAGTPIGGPASLNASGEAGFNVATLAVGQHTITACYAGNTNFRSSSGSVSQLVTFIFTGFYAPVDNNDVLNVANAGQAIPLKWELRDFFNNPVTTLASVKVTVEHLNCGLNTTGDNVEEYATGSSGLLNHGNGSYQFNWKTPNNYAKSCKTMKLDLGDGPARTALFQFRK